MHEAKCGNKEIVFRQMRMQEFGSLDFLSGIKKINKYNNNSSIVISILQSELCGQNLLTRNNETYF